MGGPKTKSPRRLKSDVGASLIESSRCGHSHCGTTCNVRYCGPTTHIRDHQIMHAARGVTHVWTAAIVAGLAVVLTGAIAYSAVQASTPVYEDVSNAQVLSAVRKLEQKVGTLEVELQAAKAAAQAAPQEALAE